MVIATDSTTRRRRTMEELLRTEGRPFWASASFSGTLSASQTLGTLTVGMYNTAVWVESLEISSNRAIDIAVTLPDQVFASRAVQHRIFIAAGDSKIIPVRQLIRTSDLALSAGNTLVIGTVTCKTVIDATATGALVQVNAIGVQAYDDLNLEADKVLLVVGDSVWSDLTGISDHGQGCHALIRSRIRTAGVNARLVNMSVPSTNTRDHERWRSQGKYNLPQIDYILYPLGINNINVPSTRTRTVTTTTGSTSIIGLFSNADVGATITGTGIPASTTITSITATSAVLSASATATGSPSASITSAALPSYTADLNSFMDWKQNSYPNAKLLVIGPTPLANTTSEATLATLRSAAASAVTTRADPKITYVSLGAAFDPTNAANYAGDGVHPLASYGAHYAMLQALASKVDAMIAA